jgi:prepilin-type N-terminal cleavage/methylation domain-containing protein
MTQRGFTLIELLVVVAIIGILAAVGVTAYSGYTASANLAATIFKIEEWFARTAALFAEAV